MDGTRVALTVADGTARITLDELYGAFRRFGQLGVPTVAAINGPAVGAGLNLALAADLRIVAAEAVLISSFAGVFARSISAEQAVDRAQQMWSLSRPSKEV